jgi:hypothetical protein
MVVMLEVAKLVGNDIFQQAFGSHDNPPIESDPCVSSAATPSRFHLANVHCIDGHAKLLGEPFHGRVDLLSCTFTIPGHESMLDGLPAMFLTPDVYQQSHRLRTVAQDRVGA